MYHHPTFQTKSVEAMYLYVSIYVSLLYDIHSIRVVYVLYATIEYTHIECMYTHIEYMYTLIEYMYKHIE